MTKSRIMIVLAVALSVGLSACSEVSVPDARNVKIPSPTAAEERREAINERPDSVMYLPLGADVLVPERMMGDGLPTDIVGPFELRSETLGGALQLILADYDVSIAFETEEGLSRRVTVANLKGRLDKVVHRVCSLADLYCSFEDGALVVKETQTFTVALPPLGDAEGSTTFIDDTIRGLTAVLGKSGSAPVSDPTTRTIIYSATQRTAQLAEAYFQRLRANTAMIVYETYIWEVALNAGNSAGIDWDQIRSFGKFDASISFAGSVAADFTNPVSLGLPTTQTGTDPSKILQFLSQFGAVKTISQPQITVLSGAEAELRVADTQNYVSEVSSTISGDNTTTSVSTDSVDSGFTLTIGSSWDKSTVYSNVNVNLANVVQIDDFAFDTDGGGGQTTIQLPQTTERELTTQIRVRPGDSVLIAGLVRETDNFDTRGPGFMEPIIPDSRTATSNNLELVILLRPRVIVYTAADDVRYKDFLREKLPPQISQDVVIEDAEQPAEVISEQVEEVVVEDIDETAIIIDKVIEEASVAPVIVVEEESVVVSPQPLDVPPVNESQAGAPTPLFPQKAIPIINDVPAPSVSTEHMMSTPAIELVNRRNQFEPVISNETFYISPEEITIEKVVREPSSYVLEKGSASKYALGYISKQVELPVMDNEHYESAEFGDDLVMSNE